MLKFSGLILLNYGSKTRPQSCVPCEAGTYKPYTDALTQCLRQEQVSMPHTNPVPTLC